MLQLIAFYLISLIPAAAIYLWLKKRPGAQRAYPGACDTALMKGMLCCLPVIGVSLAFTIIGALMGIKDAGIVLRLFWTKFVTLGVAEEAVKFFTWRSVLKKARYDYSRLDAVCLMVIVGIGFQTLEALLYAIGTTPIHMLVRGVTAMHLAFAFVMGHYGAKALATGEKIFYLPALGLPILMHGLYDMTLDEQLLYLNDDLVVVPVALAALSVVLIIVMIFYVRRRRGLTEWTKGMKGTEETEAEVGAE